MADKSPDKNLAFPLLGLFGEAGSLLSVVKKASSRSRVGDFQANFDHLTAVDVFAVGMWATRLRCPSEAACPQRCCAFALSSFRQGGALLTIDQVNKVRVRRLSCL
jgi:hypothetical protein